MCQDIHLEVRGQFIGVFFLSLPHVGSQASNSDPLACQEAHFPAEPSPLPIPRVSCFHLFMYLLGVEVKQGTEKVRRRLARGSC